MKEICYIYMGSWRKLRNSDPKHLTIHHNRSAKSTFFPFFFFFNGASVLQGGTGPRSPTPAQAEGILCAAIFLLENGRRAGRSFSAREPMRKLGSRCQTRFQPPEPGNKRKQRGAEDSLAGGKLSIQTAILR